jgi:hypothetical protein
MNDLWFQPALEVKPAMDLLPGLAVPSGKSVVSIFRLSK